MLVDEILKAGQLAEADLPAQFVEAGQATLAVADDVEGGNVDLGSRRGGTI